MGASIALTALVGLALLIRLVPVAFFPSINHPDEIFQTIEQAHRLVFGYGKIPWEFEAGTRSWLLPGALAGPIWLASLLGDGPTAYLTLIHVLLAALAASSVLCVYLWGRNFWGPWSGIVAAAVPALWPDDVYFGARTLSECVAAPLLVIGLYLAAPGYRIISRRRFLAAGLLLGAAVALRLQLAPVVAIVVCWVFVASPRLGLPALLGGLAAVLAVAGGLDAVTWDYPFQSMWRNFTYNTTLGVGDSFGVEPWHFYLDQLVASWRVTGAILLLLALVGAWRAPLLFLAAAAILLSHSFVPHKEYRFIYPAILLLTILAGLGLAQLVAWIMRQRWLSPPVWQAAALAMSFYGCAELAISPAYLSLWHGGHGMLQGNAYVSGLPSVCGIGTFAAYGGYSTFHRQVPLYLPADKKELDRDAPGFNTLLWSGPDPGLPDYRTLQCFEGTCVAQRPGTCAPIPVPAMPRPAVLGGPGSGNP